MYREDGAKGIPNQTHADRVLARGTISPPGRSAVVLFLAEQGSPSLLPKHLGFSRHLA